MLEYTIQDKQAQRALLNSSKSLREKNPPSAGWEPERRVPLPPKAGGMNTLALNLNLNKNTGGGAIIKHYT